MTTDVADEARAKLGDQWCDLWRRVKEGTLDPVRARIGLQLVIEDRWDKQAEFSLADEKVKSSYIYPEGYVVKPISEQVDILAKLFSLSLGHTSDFIEKILPTLQLPDGAEGWFAIPSIKAVAVRYFPDVKDPAEQYCRAVQLVLEKIAFKRKFYNYYKGQLSSDRLRQHERTARMLAQISKSQPGDILIIPAQFGLKHRGKSGRQAREVFTAKEFCLGTFAVGSMLLTHPERLVRWEQLQMDCAGDEYAPHAAGDFCGVPYFLFFSDGKVRFDAYGVDGARDDFGSASGFLPPACNA